MRIDGAYAFKNFDGEGTACLTHTPSNTAFRGFGGPEGTLVAEQIIEQVQNSPKQNYCMFPAKKDVS